MKRTGFVRSDSREALAASFKETPMTARRRPQSKIRASARNQDCTLCFHGVCNFDPATTVLCHSNQLADGKGMGLKAPDTRGAYGCSSCHDVLDGRRPRPDGMSYEEMIARFDSAVERTHDVLRKLGLLGAGDA